MKVTLTDTDKNLAEELAQKLLKTIGKESPVIAMNALYLAMQAVDASLFGLRKKK